MELKEFKITVLPLRAKLLNYARKLTDEPEDAEDAVQEVLLKLWNKRLELEQYQSIEAFAMTLTHNICIDMWRCKRNDNLSLDIVQAASPTGTPERLLEIKDEMRLMHEIIRSLPPLQRTIMQMKDIEGYETDEIAEITGCSPEAIRSNLSRARKKVRDIYLQTIQEKKRKEKEAMKIDELLNKYFEGETSCEEERRLRRFFTEEEVPEHLQTYRPLFAYLEKEVGKKTPTLHRKSIDRHRLFRLWSGIAAGLLLLFGLSELLFPVSAESGENYVIIDGTRYTDENLAKAKALEALQMASLTQEELNRLILPDINMDK